MGLVGGLPDALVLGPHRFPLGARTYLMGIVNLTDDSFTRIQVGADVDAAVERIRSLIADGAHVIDIGAESTEARENRPLSPEAELQRLVPVLERVAEEGLDRQAAIAVDTWKAPVAARVLDFPVHCINDVTSFLGDPELLDVVGRARVPVCLMHQKVLHQNAPEPYDDVLGELVAFFEVAVAKALAAGVPPDGILIDPGFGFQKDVRADLEVTRQLGALRVRTGKPVLHAPSRKLSIGTVLAYPAPPVPPSERLYGTAALAALSVAYGADMLRVHDVRVMADVLKVADALVRGFPPPWAPPERGSGA